MFTTKECPVCHEIKAGLNRRHIPYEDRDLADPENIVYLRCDVGMFSVQAPIICDDGQWIGGEDQEGIAKFKTKYQI